MKKKTVTRIISACIIAFLLAFVTVGNIVCYKFENQITSMLCAPIVDQQALQASREAGKALSEQIESEGIVMVKNDGGVLPLSQTDDQKVNVFGRTSTDWVMGGSGSGCVTPEDNNNNYESTTDFLKALKEYGIDYNTAITDMYKNYFAPVRYNISYNQRGSLNAAEGSGGVSAFYYLAEPSISDKSRYSETMLNDAKNYSQTAMVVISRMGGEKIDPPKVQYKKNASNDSDRTYLELSTEEEALLTYVGANYEKVIVIINSTNVMELGFLDSIAGIDACLLVGATGTNGATAIPKVLYGDISPSGRTDETYPYDLSTNINYNFAGEDGQNAYTTTLNSSFAQWYADYVEGIYVGYRWYETADVEGCWENKGGYDKVVQFPFGYGMSYTSFEWSIKSVSIASGTSLKKDDSIEIEVDVTNTGRMAGKEVVELYGSAPYYEGGIEKSSVVLLDFVKTATIEPGLTQTVKLSFDLYDFASYDYNDSNHNGFSGYEAEHGEYKIMLQTDAHNKAVVSASSPVANDISYRVDADIKYETDPVTGAKVENHFTGDDAVDGMPLDGGTSENITYISRADFPTTYAKPAARAASDILKNTYLYGNTKADTWDNATVDAFGNAVDDTAPTWSNGKSEKIYENGSVTELGYALGKDYNDERWDDLLSQMSLSEAVNLNRSGFTTAAIPSIGKPALTDYDGPAQILGYTSVAQRGTGYPPAVVLARTWNKELAYDFGLSMAKDMGAVSVNGNYGIGVNIKRSPFQGRNFEYYSEDPLLTGVMASRVFKGLANGGKYGYVKHFALAQAESNRRGTFVWTTEQAMREIYLKGFQMAIQKGDATGMMTAFNRIGAVYAGGSEAALQGVVRNEWGFKGAIITDYIENATYMDQDQALRSGGNLGLAGGLNMTYNSSSSARIQNRLQESVKQVVYSWLHVQYINSQYNASADVGQQIISKVTPVFEWWKPMLLDITILDFVACAIWGYFIIQGIVLDKKKKREGGMK